LPSAPGSGMPQFSLSRVYPLRAMVLLPVFIPTSPLLAAVVLFSRILVLLEVPVPLAYFFRCENDITGSASSFFWGTTVGTSSIRAVLLTFPLEPWSL